MKIFLFLATAAALAGQSLTQNWEARTILGLEQSAASSSPSRLSYVLDIFILRSLGNADASAAQSSVWGEVRLGAVPQQLNLSTIDPRKTNQLAQSEEFLTGYEWRPRRWIWKDNPNGIRTLGMIAGFGATAPFGQTPGQFYKQWGAGVRITTFDRTNRTNPPATYSVTLGQDQLNGNSLRAVARFDVFYPLMVNADGVEFLYLLGTASLRLSKDQGAGSDYYRLGVGMDVVTALARLGLIKR